MGGGKAPKEYLLEQAKKEHKDVTGYGKKKISLADFLSNRLDHSAEFIYDLIKEWEETSQKQRKAK